MGQQISVERVAEIMWQRGNDTEPAVKAHLAWLALAEDERRYWCDRAEAAIADWHRAIARNGWETWSNLMKRWLASRLTNDLRHAAGRDDHSLYRRRHGLHDLPMEPAMSSYEDDAT